jgi:hypothetical protein
LAQQVVGGDHGAAADRQRCGEGPVGWQRLAGRQFALVDQSAQARRQQHVQRPPARWPAAQALTKLDWLHLQTNFAALALESSPPPGKHGRVTTRQPDEDQLNATVPGQSDHRPDRRETAVLPW